MRIYELALIFKSSLSEVQRKKLFETVKGFLKGIKVTNEEIWGEKAFAYPVKREKTGFYSFLTIEGENIPSDLEKKMLEQENILRFLVIRKK